MILLYIARLAFQLSKVVLNVSTKRVAKLDKAVDTSSTAMTVAILLELQLWHMIATIGKAVAVWSRSLLIDFHKDALGGNE